MPSATRRALQRLLRLPVRIRKAVFDVRSLQSYQTSEGPPSPVRLNPPADERLLNNGPVARPTQARPTTDYREWEQPAMIALVRLQRPAEEALVDHQRVHGWD